MDRVAAKKVQIYFLFAFYLHPSAACDCSEVAMLGDLEQLLFGDMHCLLLPAY